MNRVNFVFRIPTAYMRTVSTYKHLRMSIFLTGIFSQFLFSLSILCWRLLCESIASNRHCRHIPTFSNYIKLLLTKIILYGRVLMKFPGEMCHEPRSDQLLYIVYIAYCGTSRFTTLSLLNLISHGQ